MTEIHRIGLTRLPNPKDGGNSSKSMKQMCLEIQTYIDLNQGIVAFGLFMTSKDIFARPGKWDQTSSGLATKVFEGI